MFSMFDSMFWLKSLGVVVYDANSLSSDCASTEQQMDTFLHIWCRSYCSGDNVTSCQCTISFPLSTGILVLIFIKEVADNAELVSYLSYLFCPGHWPAVISSSITRTHIWSIAKYKTELPWYSKSTISEGIKIVSFFICILFKTS